VAAYRSPVALSDLITRQTRYRLRLAMVLGAGAAIMVSLLAGQFEPDAPASLSSAALVGLAFVVVSLPAFAAPHLLDLPGTSAVETMYWAAIGSAARSAEITGERRIPATPAQAVAWLARQPDTDAARHLRVFCQLVVGDLPAARELAARLGDATPIDRARQAASQELIRLVEGGQPDVARLRAIGGELAPEDRLRVEIDATLLESLEASADGGDWAAPLIRLRERIGAAADGVLLRHFWPPIIIALLAGGVLLGVGTYGIHALLNG
jgi:hypothetical protein